MGKTQSKRSVDITTEGKNNPDEDVTGKLEKIEDLDQKQVNGDATQEAVNAEKNGGDEVEKNKDLANEKCLESAHDESVERKEGQNTTSNADAAELLKEDSATVQEGNKTTEEISGANDDSNKKSKKEKVKKKWSFRSISFGKKDKQKPAKSEEIADNVATLNGEPAEADNFTEGTNEKVRDEAGGDAVASSPEKIENGNASDKELNGEMTPITPSAEENTKGASFNESTTNNITTETPSTDNTDINSTTATKNNQTEKTINTTATLVESAAEAAPALVSNGAETEKNVSGLLLPTDDMNEVTTDKAADLVEASVSVAEVIKSIPNVVNDGFDIGVNSTERHQNGVSADGEPTELKSQVEVTLQTEIDVLTNKLDTLSTTTSSPTAPFNNLDPNNDLKKMEIDTDNEQTEYPTLETNVISQDNLVNKSENGLSDLQQDEQQEEIDKAVHLAESLPQNPPPLPTSPPPSQMSVFAFNDRNKPNEVCETVETEIAEGTTKTPSISQIDIVENLTEVGNSNIEQVKECVSQQPIDNVVDDSSENLIIEGEENAPNNPSIESNIELKYQNDFDLKEQAKDSAENDFKEMDDLTVLTDIIDEITENAVEMNQFHKNTTDCQEYNDKVKEYNITTEDNGVEKFMHNIESVSAEDISHSDEKSITLSNSIKSNEIICDSSQEPNNILNNEYREQNKNEKEEFIKDCIILNETGIESITGSEN